MKRIYTFVLAASLFAISANAQEKHLKNLQQLTFGGDNAEAYFSFDGKHLSFQSNNKAWGLNCDQIFSLDIKKASKDSTYRPPLISTGKGRTTCSFFLNDNKHILYASTHGEMNDCPTPPAPRADHKYLWQVSTENYIYVADMNGKI